ncbi:protein KRI1 homolog isoform X2 [Varroa jacobsoni]|nr:protein KRI1 homolog isoform X2 [Varroa jacobsoni]
MTDLFAGCSSSEEDVGNVLRTDNAYARHYDDWRRKEELMKAKARYGSDLEASFGSQSSDTEEEDEEARQWTSEHEKKFLATLSALKGRDPRIYKKNEIIFGDVQSESNQVSQAGKLTGEAGCEDNKSKAASFKEKKMTLKDYERKIISEEGGIYVDDEEIQGPRARLIDETHQDKLTYDDEQRALRDSLKAAAWETDDDESGENNDLAGGLVSRKKRKLDQEIKEEEEEYVKWLKGETDRLSNKKEAKELAELKRLWTEAGEEKLDEAEKFLRDYVLNKRYLTSKDDDFKFEVDFSEDEKDIEEMNEFEHKYNFRFEDPDPDFIKRYPRTIEDSMRRKDTRRADKKAERKARKEQERVQLREEINRLKSMKKKEILSKIDKLKNIAGNADIAFNDADIDGDFDPEEHDRRMVELFASYDEEAGEDFYPELEEDDHDLDDLRYDDWDKYEGEKIQFEDEGSEDNEDQYNDLEKDHAPGFSGLSQSIQSSKVPEKAESQSNLSSSGEAIETGHGNVNSSDLDENNVIQRKETDGIERTSEGKLLIRGKKSAKLTLRDILPQNKEKKRRKSKFAEALARNKPTFDPERDQKFEKYFDEYYKLDFEDVVGGLQTRFKYRQVIPNDFGLSTEEILNAHDKELNKWCTLKKMVQYRSEEEENKDLHVYNKRKDHMHLKQKILASVYPTDIESPDAEIVHEAAEAKTTLEPKPKSKSRKNKKKKQRTTQQVETDHEDNVQEGDHNEDFDDKNYGKSSIDKDDIQKALPKKRKRSPMDREAGTAEQKKPKVAKGGDARVTDEVKIAEMSSVEHRISEPVRSDTDEQEQEKGNAKKTNKKIDYNKKDQRRTELETSGKFVKKSHEKGKRFGNIQKKSLDKKTQNMQILKKSLDRKAKKAKKGFKVVSSETSQFDTIPWDQLTAKQKKNRRNAMIKKRKKAETNKQKMQDATRRKNKFRRLEELQMSEARMKAYGLNPNKVKGNLVYSSGLSGKSKLKVDKAKNQEYKESSRGATDV